MQEMAFTSFETYMELHIRIMIHTTEVHQTEEMEISCTYAHSLAAHNREKKRPDHAHTFLRVMLAFPCSFH
jgi:hypothetical protein